MSKTKHVRAVGIEQTNMFIIGLDHQTTRAKADTPKVAYITADIEGKRAVVMEHQGPNIRTPRHSHGKKPARAKVQLPNTTKNPRIDTWRKQQMHKPATSIEYLDAARGVSHCNPPRRPISHRDRMV